MILDSLMVDGKKLLNKSDPYYQTYIKGKDLTHEEWFNVLRSRPSLLRSPVALYRGKAVICETPTDVLRVMQGATIVTAVR
jgi:arsenate reductase